MDCRAREAPDLLSDAPPPPAGRDQGLDVARGLLMAWIIVMIHGVFWLGVLPRGPGSLLLFEMPPIFVITGAAYFLGEGGKQGRLQPGAYVDFLLRRAVRIYLPFAVYVLAAAVLVTIVKWDGPLTLGEGVARIGDWLNPVTRGAGLTWKMLSWHLWFIAPFMIVTALMPFITTTRLPSFVRPWMLAVLSGLVVLAVGQVSFAAPLDDQLIKNTIFYALWASLGFVLAASPKRWSVRDYALVLALSLAGLFAAALLQPETVSLDMQQNKFPPNAMFFLFSCAWMAVLLIGSRALSVKQIDALAASPLLKPFMKSGYSIYLWQGIGYSLAAYAGEVWDVSKYVVWVAAIALTIALGLLFSPLERIRLPKRRAA